MILFIISTFNFIIMIVYFVILAFFCLRIIFETHSSTKTLAYLLLCIFIPVIGIIFYITFGINYWKKKLYTRKTSSDEKMLEELKLKVLYYGTESVKTDALIDEDARELANMVIKDNFSPLTRKNTVKLLLNGEEKFPELIAAI